MKLYAPSTIREIKEKYGFRLTKSLGQNFLTDKNIIDRIIEGAHIGENDLVIEIGPGKTLSGFMRKINRDVKTINIEKLADLEKLAELQ